MAGQGVLPEVDNTTCTLPFRLGVCPWQAPTPQRQGYRVIGRLGPLPCLGVSGSGFAPEERCGDKAVRIPGRDLPQ